MKLTKALSLILALVMLLSTLALGVTAEEVFATPTGTVLFPHLHQTGPDGKNGYTAPTPAEIPVNATTMTALKESGKNSVDYAVENRVFTISTAEEMVIFSERVNAGDQFFMATVYLNGENGYIDMAGINNFQPIGDTKTVEGVNPALFFRGTFDGRGQSIKNLVMTSNGGDYTNVALFGCIRGAAIINLVIDSSCSFTYTGTSTTARTAGVVAWSASTGMDGHGVNSPANGDYAVGAYYGYAADNNYHTSTVTAVISHLIMNVKNCATVNGGTGYAGGIIATTTSWTGYQGMAKNCTQAANVSGRVAGGILAAPISCGGGARQFRIVECQVKADTNKTVIISGDAVGAPYAQTNGWAIALDNYGMYNGVELRQNINGYNYETVGYSYSNVVKVDTAALPTTSTLTTDASKSAYKIVTADDFIAFANYVNAGNNMAGKTVYLANDIDWPAEKAFVTVGHNAARATGASLPAAIDTYRHNDNNLYFAGTFDGQGYVLDNVKMTLSTTVAGGIFGLLKGTVKNVVLGYGCEFNSTVKSATAALVGMLYNGQTNSGVVMNCFTGATVTSATNSGAGGLVAVVSGATNGYMPVIRNCTNAGTVTGGWQAGGMVVWAVRTVSVLYCLNTGSVHAAAGSESGAMIGYSGWTSAMVGCESATQPTWNKDGSQPLDTMIGSKGQNFTVQTMNRGPGNEDVATKATIRYAGYQTKTVEGKVTAVRILAVVDSLEVAKVGFMLSANDVIYDYSTTTVYGSLLAGTQGVATETILAENLGGKYVVAVTITGIPAESTTITLGPYADSNYGAEVSIELN